MATQKFTDADGRDWLIDLDILTVDRVLKSTGFNLYRGLDPENSAKLNDNPGLFFEVIFETLRTQASERKMTIDDFKKACGKTMDVMVAAGECLTEALINFSPSPHRPLIQQMRAKTLALEAATMNLAKAEIDRLDPEAEAKKLVQRITLNRAATAKPAKPATAKPHAPLSSDSPESAESTPTAPA